MKPLARDIWILLATVGSCTHPRNVIAAKIVLQCQWISVHCWKYGHHIIAILIAVTWLSKFGASVVNHIQPVSSIFMSDKIAFTTESDIWYKEVPWHITTSIRLHSTLIYSRLEYPLTRLQYHLVVCDTQIIMIGDEASYRSRRSCFNHDWSQSLE